MKHKKLTWGLALVVIAVWSSIAYQVYSSLAVEPNGDGASVVNLKGRKMGTHIRYAYISNVRDPFRYFSARGQASRKKAMVSAKEGNWGPPPFRLTGILARADSRTAILERNDGAVFFVHEGDTLEGVKVLRVRDREVHYVFRKMKREWVIRE